MCAFKISEDDWAEMAREDGRTTLPKGFLCHIAMHTVGTVRGILHVKTENTPFNRYILPVIDVEQTIDEDIIVDVKPDN